MARGGKDHQEKRQDETDCGEFAHPGRLWNQPNAGNNAGQDTRGQREPPFRQIPSGVVGGGGLPVAKTDQPGPQKATPGTEANFFNRSMGVYLQLKYQYSVIVRL